MGSGYASVVSQFTFFGLGKQKKAEKSDKVGDFP
jgi:hypothetical protein